jgi:hypothetical protein
VLLAERIGRNFIQHFTASDHTSTSQHNSA